MIAQPPQEYFPFAGRPGRLLQRTHALWYKPVEFWLKISNDWIFSLSAIVAYNLLFSTIPILLALLVLAGALFDIGAPSNQAALERSLVHALPSGIGVTVVGAVARHIKASASFILLVSTITSIVVGSRLFIAMESCFGVIFRLRGRSLLRQNVMAVSMYLIYVLLAPLLFLGSIVPAALIRAIDPDAHSPVRGFVIQATGVVVALVVSIVLFGLIYIIVPNHRIHWRELWRGTLVAAGLLVLYEAFFPIYVSLLLRPSNYGSVVGLILVILIFFFYLAFILLLGAEVNSWHLGQRRALGDLAAIVHEVQAHRTVEGVAGLTAGLPTEDLQHHKGAAVASTPEAMLQHERRDHRHDAHPPLWWRPAPRRETANVRRESEGA